MSITPKRYAVLLKDNNGNRVANLENIISQLTWEWDRIGGCGACRMRLNENWDGVIAGSLAEDYQLEIYAPVAGGTADLWYSGFIDRIKPRVDASNEIIDVLALGYVNQLKRVVIKDRTFSGIEMADAAKDIIDNNVTAITDITSTAADYEETDFAADTLFFNEDAHSVIRKLAGIAGKREWGVRADKSFFFLKEDRKRTRTFNITEDFIDYTPLTDFNPIITRLFLQGGENYSGRFTVVNRKTTREAILTNSSITTQSVGQQFARSFLKRNGREKKSYKASLVEQNKRLETTIPLGSAAVNVKIGINNKYNDPLVLYNQGFRYNGGTQEFQIDKIRYTLRDDNIDVMLNFGPVPPSLADELNRLEVLINNEGNI